MTRKHTAEDLKWIAERAEREAAAEARYGKHAKISPTMRSEFLNMAWATEAREAAFAQAAAEWGVGEDGILRLPADREAMLPAVAEAVDRMWEIFGTFPPHNPSRVPLDRQIQALRGAFHHKIWLEAGGRLHEIDEARNRR